MKTAGYLTTYSSIMQAIGIYLSPTPRHSKRTSPGSRRTVPSPSPLPKGEGVVIKDINDAFGGIAIQGPASQQILSKLCEADLSRLKHRHFIETKVDGFYALLSRSGYTGEDGFEIFIPADASIKIWNDMKRRAKDT